MKLLDKFLMILISILINYFTCLWAIRTNIDLFYDLNRRQVDKELKKKLTK